MALLKHEAAECYITKVNKYLLGLQASSYHLSKQSEADNLSLATAQVGPMLFKWAQNC